MLFKNISPGTENISMNLKIRSISEVLTYESNSNRFSKKKTEQCVTKKYFTIIGFDGDECNRIAIFEASHRDKLIVEKTYKFAGLSCSSNSYDEYNVTFGKGSITELDDNVITNQYSNLINIAEIVKSCRNLSIVGVVVQIFDKEEVYVPKTKTNCTLFTIKVRDKSGIVFLKSWNKAIPVKEGEGYVFENLKAKLEYNKIELFYGTSSLLNSEYNIVADVKKWLLNEGKDASTINISMSTKPSNEDVNEKKNDDCKEKRKKKKNNNKRKRQPSSSSDSESSDEDSGDDNHEKKKRKNDKINKKKNSSSSSAGDSTSESSESDSDGTLQQVLKLLSKKIKSKRNKKSVKNKSIKKKKRSM